MSYDKTDIKTELDCVLSNLEIFRERIEMAMKYYGIVIDQLVRLRAGLKNEDV